MATAGDVHSDESDAGTHEIEVSAAKAVLWFPDKPVAARDVIVVYSRQGTVKEKTNASGSTSHFFYFGSGEPLWTSKNAAVLLRIAEWAKAVADSDQI